VACASQSSWPDPTADIAIAHKAIFDKGLSATLIPPPRGTTPALASPTPKESTLLRITRTQKDGGLWLRLEGKLVGPWVDEFKSAIAREETPPDAIWLDLTDVRFVDSRGLYCLHVLTSQGCRIHKTSSFLAELMRTETSP